MNTAPILSERCPLAGEICINSSIPLECQPGRADALVTAHDKLDLSQTNEVSLSEAIQSQDDVQTQASNHLYVQQAPIAGLRRISQVPCMQSLCVYQQPV